ncbi:hypothetical protein TNCV_2816081 [Trichonephila clavipes]|nr:hypothetical protein TNCV_2816081 [Trichonephila clavipes]
MLIRSVQWGIKCKERKHHSTYAPEISIIRGSRNNSNIQHAETAEDISKDRNKELGSSSVQGVPSTDVAVPDLSQSSAKETDRRRVESTSSRQAISCGRSENQAAPRDLFFKEGGRCGIFNCNQLKT